jgi:hypothetical protein
MGIKKVCSAATWCRGAEAVSPLRPCALALIRLQGVSGRPFELLRNC